MEPTRKEVKGSGFDQLGWDSVTQISRQNTLEFIIEPVHFSEAFNHVGFYELFVL
jgi:hypothetical protein